MGNDDAASSKSDDENAIATFFRYPHNSLLGVEIAKTLYYRKRCSEAAEILRILLSINPGDLVARTLRMMLFRNMALDTPSQRSAGRSFPPGHPGSGKHSGALRFSYRRFLLRIRVSLPWPRPCRPSGICGTHPELHASRKEFKKLQRAVYKGLDQAKQLFEKGMSVSFFRNPFILFTENRRRG